MSSLLFLVITFTLFYLGLCGDVQTSETSLMQSVIDDTALDEKLWIFANSHAETYSVNLIKNLVYRLDIVPCGTSFPPENRKVLYWGIVYSSYYRRRFRCLVRYKGPYQIIGNSDQTFFDITPQTYKNGKYKKRVIEHFNIMCPKGKHGKILEISTNIQERVKIGDQHICLDYLKIELPESKNIFELCGKDGHSSLNLPSYSFTKLHVTFRSGPIQEYKNGFRIIVVCSDNSLSSQTGCLSTNEKVSAEQYLFERAMVNYDSYIDNYSLESESGEYIPQGAKQHLIKFYHENHIKALTNSIDSYRDVLQLAVVTLKSCDEWDVAVAQAVLELFPTEMVNQALHHQSN